jgi:hypothetical protein
VPLLCRVLGVSASAFYAWAARDGEPGPQAQRDAKRIVLIRQAWTEHRQVYGARRLTAELHERGHRINGKAVARLMRLAGIQGIHRRRGGKPGRHRRGGQLETVAADLVRRQFTAPAPDRLWVAEITYLRSWQGFLYLAVVIDACSRRVLRPGPQAGSWAGPWPIICAPSWSWTRPAWPCSPASPSAASSSTIVTADPIHLLRVRPHLRAFGGLASMVSVTDAFDNALAESFFATLECELLDRHPWPDRQTLRTAVFDFIETSH